MASDSGTEDVEGKPSVPPAKALTVDHGRGHRPPSARGYLGQTYHPTFNEAPWGGYKQSGICRELGTDGCDAYTEVKQFNTHVAPGRPGWVESV